MYRICYLGKIDERDILYSELLYEYVLQDKKVDKIREKVVAEVGYTVDYKVKKYKIKKWR